MSDSRHLLIEIGTEELPPKALKRLSNAFTQGVIDGIDKAGLSHGEVEGFASPRRLAILIHDLAANQGDKAVERKGPSLKAAFDDEGNPTKAALGFAQSCRVDISDLETVESENGAWLMFRSVEQGQPTAALIPAIVQLSLDRLPIPKRMRWGDLDAEFVRPVHWLVLLFGDQVIDAEILSVRAGRETRGHRFHHPEPLYLAEPEAYAPLLETEGRVIVDFAARREAVRAQVMAIAATHGGHAVIDEELLDEVTGLVEWPVAILGRFEERFLAVPAECLISAMKGHQKYFHMVDSEGKLMPHFITLCNIESSNPDKVREGNERVIRPRLTDAEFFWEKDKKTPLVAQRERLKTVLFQNKLGTLYDKSLRVEALAVAIAGRIGGDPILAARAAQLAKCDLLTEMVFEFTELQGIMGTYYARNDGEPEEVARALDEQYMPRFAGDELPTTHSGQAIAIADKVDTLVGLFAIGQPPTGDKDPFALRRATLGALRIIIERRLDIDIVELLEQAVQQLTAAAIPVADGTVAQVFDFMLERLRNLYLEQGVAADTIESVLVRRPSQPLDFDQRVKAVNAFRELPAAATLAAANKRSANILKKVTGTLPALVDPTLLLEPAEVALAEQLASLSRVVTPLLAQRHYSEALTHLAELREAVDAFFDQVMVMADDEAIRNNRIALLNSLQGLFLQVADLSKLQG